MASEPAGMLNVAEPPLSGIVAELYPSLVTVTVPVGVGVPLTATITVSACVAVIENEDGVTVTAGVTLVTVTLEAPVAPLYVGELEESGV